MEIAKVHAVPIPFHLRSKVMRTRGASESESEKYHNVLHIHDRDQMSNCVNININL